MDVAGWIFLSSSQDMDGEATLMETVVHEQRWAALTQLEHLYTLRSLH